MGLGVVEHLQAVLERAVGDVVGRQIAGGAVVDPTPAGECRQGGKGLALAQAGVAAAGDELPGLGEELDLADATLAELEVVAGDDERAGEALVAADAEPHVVGVLDRRVIEVAAPDEGAEAVEKCLSGGDGAGAGARLDIGGAFPGPAEALVVALGRFGGDADRGDGRVGAQA